jgi:hypothetical protein
MLKKNIRTTQPGALEFQKAQSYQVVSVATADNLEAIRQMNYALNHYTTSVIQTMIGLADQIDELSEQVERLQNVASTFGLSTKLR